MVEPLLQMAPRPERHHVDRAPLLLQFHADADRAQDSGRAPAGNSALHHAGSIVVVPLGRDVDDRVRPPARAHERVSGPGYRHRHRQSQRAHHLDRHRHVARHHHVGQCVVHHLAETADADRAEADQRTGSAADRARRGTRLARQHAAFDPDGLLHDVRSTSTERFVPASCVEPGPQGPVSISDRRFRCATAIAPLQ